MYPTHLIYRALGKPQADSEPCAGICAFCGAEIQEGIKIEDAVSDAFTNFDLLTDLAASHVCPACYACLKDTRLRRMNFIATEQDIVFFGRSGIEKWLFSPPEPPFIFAVTESMKKHNSFKARVNYSQKLFYVQKEDTQILFSPDKYRDIFGSMNRLYTIFLKNEIISGIYKQKFIKKYGISEFMHDEEIINNERGSLQFDLLLFAMNMGKKTERIPKIK